MSHLFSLPPLSTRGTEPFSGEDWLNKPQLCHCSGAHFPPVATSPLSFLSLRVPDLKRDLSPPPISRMPDFRATQLSKKFLFPRVLCPFVGLGDPSLYIEAGFVPFVSPSPNNGSQLFLLPPLRTPPFLWLLFSAAPKQHEVLDASCVLALFNAVQVDPHT